MADLDLSHPRFRRQFSFVLYDKIARDFEDLLKKCRPNKKTDLIAACIRYALAEISGNPDPQNDRDIERLKKHYQTATQSSLPANEDDISIFNSFSFGTRSFFENNQSGSLFINFIANL